ncbi:unnamed protein product [Diplocarpon coronariae]
MKFFSSFTAATIFAMVSLTSAKCTIYGAVLEATCTPGNDDSKLFCHSDEIACEQKYKQFLDDSATSANEKACLYLDPNETCTQAVCCF